jgi:S1-C subfamily serine protease
VSRWAVGCGGHGVVAVVACGYGEVGGNRGDLLIAVDDHPTRSEAALHAALGTADATIALHVLRGDMPLTIKVTTAGRSKSSE